MASQINPELARQREDREKAKVEALFQRINGISKGNKTGATYDDDEDDDGEEVSSTTVNGTMIDCVISK